MTKPANNPESNQEWSALLARALPECRDVLQRGDAALADRFHSGESATSLVKARAELVDGLLLRAWECAGLGNCGEELALVAVGGYGRGELHPGSDVDVLVLIAADDGAHDGADVGAAGWKERVEGFLRFLWDLGLDLGHSVRTVDECVAEAARDVTTATNLMEARALTGSKHLVESLREATGTDRIWPGPKFFAAKWEEQQQRHARFHDTAYNLEPNIKEGPGGLRDIQMIGWVAQRHFGAGTLHDLVTDGSPTESEYEALSAGQEQLWRIRYGLHLAAGRREDRLLFELQRALAEMFGFQDKHEENLGVEQFMQSYYRTVMELERLNEMLLQLYQETLLLPDESERPVPINARFQSRRGFLEVTGPEVFREQPSALMELFPLLQTNPELKGVRATTIRAVREHRHLINEEFRADPAVHEHFLNVLRQPAGVYAQLQRMNRYGVLPRYIPAFGNVVGRMQYDLFHVYTVDQHSLFCVKNLRHYSDPESAVDFPVCHIVFGQLRRPELLYLAGLFHDIAKGRGGDHSELGALDAEQFCRQQGLDEKDAQLVAWLVRNHLIMSVTAQKQDISDPAVVEQFARKVADLERLEYLYLLTVADIRATSPRLWNAWKASLLRELFETTRTRLSGGMDQAPDLQAQAQRTREQAMKHLGPVDQDALKRLWASFPDEYFLKHDPDQLAWHADVVLRAQSPEPLVATRQNKRRGTTEVFVHAPDQDGLFATIAESLDRMRLDVVQARIFTSNQKMAVDTFQVLHGDAGEHDPDRITHTLKRDLLQPVGLPAPASRRLPRRMRHFALKTRVTFGKQTSEGQTMLEIVASDRPGLLSQITATLVECGIRIHSAKIATFGNRVEDFFFVSDRHGHALTSQTRKDSLRQTLIRKLDNDND